MTGWAPMIGRRRLSVELEACEPATVVDEAATFGVRAREIDNGGRYGWPIYRYTGTRAQLLAWLAEAYNDGSGETAAELLERCEPVELVT